MLTFNPAKMNPRTKAIVVLLLAVIGSVSVPAVREFTATFLAHHPALAQIMGALLTLIATLQNPKYKTAIEKAFGVEDDV